MSNDKHSPLPWSHTWGNVHDISDANDRSLFNSTDYYPWCSENDADWPFIVKAVNCHQELVDALKAIAANSDEDNEWDAVEKLHSNAERARAALAKAEA